MRAITVLLASLFLIGTAQGQLDSPETRLRPISYVQETAERRTIKTATQKYITHVITTDYDGARSVGTGTYIGAGVVLTAKHVIRDARRVYVVLNGKQTPVTVLSKSKADQALLWLGEQWKDVPGVNIATREVQRGEYLIGAGYDYGGERLRYWQGRVTSFGSTPGAPNMNVSFEGQQQGSVQGCSGGPIFNTKGELVSNLWGSGNWNETTGITNTATRKFVQETCWRFPILTCIARRIQENLEPPTLPQPPSQPSLPASVPIQINVPQQSTCPDGQCNLQLQVPQQPATLPVSPPAVSQPASVPAPVQCLLQKQFQLSLPLTVTVGLN